MFSMQGKKAFITGGTAGIGLAVAKCFVEAGATVIISGRRDGDAIAEEIGATFLRLDVVDEKAVADSFWQAEQRIGKLDTIVNNAGISTSGMLEEVSADEAKQTFDINFNGVLYGLKYGPRHMNDGGSIINTSSAAARLMTPAYGIYSSSKAAVSHLTRAAALELADRKVRVNAVLPGGIDTEMSIQADDDATPVAMFDVLTPLRRIGTTDDLIGIYNLLASDFGAYITGQEFVVDGGMSAGYSAGALDKILAEPVSQDARH
mgnify:CR=1 FL=1